MYNEAENVADLVARSTPAWPSRRSWEIVLVNDGSTDQTERRPSDCRGDERVRVASYTPIGGEQSAAHRLRAARGEFVRH